jgi:hypothetical protein
MYGKTEAGVGLPVLVDSSGKLITAKGGKYAEATLAGRMFAVANQAVVNVTVGMALTYTGLALCNPAGSGKNLVILGFGCAAIIAVPTAACTIGIMTGGGIGAATAVIAARNRLSNGPASVAYADSAVVFTEAPVLEELICTYHTGAVTTGLNPGVHVDLEGSIAVAPGYHVSPFASAINNATFMFSWLWEEVDV